MNGVTDSSGSRYRLPPHSPHRDPFLPGTGVRTRWFGTKVPFINCPAARPHITHWTLKTCMSRGTLTTMIALPEAQARGRAKARCVPIWLRGEAAQPSRFDDSVHRQDVRRGAGIDLELFFSGPHRIEGGDHLFFESLVHLGFLPEVA